MPIALLLVPAAIGLGAAAQAAVGAWLIRRFVRRPLTLTEAGDVLRFFALGAPVACLVSASVGTLALLASAARCLRAARRSTWLHLVGRRLARRTDRRAGGVDADRPTARRLDRRAA